MFFFIQIPIITSQQRKEEKARGGVHPHHLPAFLMILLDLLATHHTAHSKHPTIVVEGLKEHLCWLDWTGWLAVEWRRCCLW